MSIQDELKRRSEEGQKKIQKEKEEWEQEKARKREVQNAGLLDRIEAQIKNYADNGKRQSSMQPKLPPLHGKQ